ncbi:hypothetical protein C8R47DRAFT_724004 [Mycena vitilis]|nr:hypothetical protein C8R47DRAFT_724004 [Mycena vitilis]
MLLNICCWLILPCRRSRFCVSFARRHHRLFPADSAPCSHAASWHQPPPNHHQCRPTSVNPAFLVHFTFIRKRFGFVLALFLVQRPHILIVLSLNRPYKSFQFPSFG